MPLVRQKDAIIIQEHKDRFLHTLRRGGNMINKAYEMLKGELQ